MSNSSWPYGTQHARPLCPSPTPGVYSNWSLLTHWCHPTWWAAIYGITQGQTRLKWLSSSSSSHPTISSSIVPFFCLQSFPASGSFPMSRLFTSGGQSIGVSASALILAMIILGWFPLGLAGLIFLPFKGLIRIFSSTTIWKHQFFSTQPSLGSNLHIHTWLLEKP